MVKSIGWVAAPEGQVLIVGECRARDADGQGCTRGVFHPLSPHQSTGLRAWLESSDEPAVIRCYDAARADELESMEAGLFAQFDFVPIARQDRVQTKDGGLNSAWAFYVSPLIAPTEKVTISLRIVCFARSLRT